MTKRSTWIQIVLFLLFIFAFFVLNLVLPSKPFSEQENRALAQAPEFSFDALFSGKYTTNYETYITDQFAFRDSWTTMKAASELVLGKQQNKDVYLCADDTLIVGYKKPDKTQLDANVEAIKSLSKSAGVPVYFALIPSLSEVKPTLLPKYAINDSQSEVIDYAYANSDAINIDMLSTLTAHKDEYIYYRTDHHWTSLGAFYGYETIMKSMGLPSAPLSSFTPKTVSTDFYGTVYSKSGMSWIGPDSMDIFVEQEATTQVFNYPEAVAVAGTMYNYDFLEKKDKYSMYMGGITPLLTVKTAETEAPSILIIRDSYMDSLTPFLQNDFSNIHIMDLRYYKTRLMDSTIADYVKEHNIDQVLVAYGVSTFATDTNVFLLGK